ncbi:FKBP-type peptidyl-prolyl cis-trans isomerase [Trueperella pyogenes]|uniref:FKBP-type peptidyl-prolyl cis-trans isomerase n=1 Tax=Trueperella pyogenes TaxID=1661 RepID=UPI002167118B|nr:FKBP-type peptidyl-prolyl cis-trans isomerase [Trueperella pyogenes]UVJ52873.1 FKBP-type peptidyl-prolyl cis-trans isomerase [Trueperella pyogenes]
MNRWQRIGLMVFAVIFGLTIGFALSAAQHRLSVTRQPIAVKIGGALGASVAVSVTGSVNFLTDEGLSGRTTTIDLEGHGRKIEKDGQVLVRVSTFYLREDGLTTQTGHRYYTGSAGESVLGTYADVVIGQQEGSRIVVFDPETARTGTISVVDVLPTVLQGKPGDTQPNNGLPGVGSDDAGRPVLRAPGGAVQELHEATVIQGAGEQITAGDTVVVNYLLAKADGTVLENTWEAAKPVVMRVEDVFEGLKSGLQDTRVGSRLVLAVPAAKAQGESDVAIVIDVLAKLSEE